MAHFLKLCIVSSPLGFLYLPKPDHVCRLQKVLYGLKQAPRGRFKWFADHLYNFNFLGSKSDTSLFDNRRGFDMPNLLLYVDDFILTALSVFVRFTISGHFILFYALQLLGILVDILKSAKTSDCNLYRTLTDTKGKLSATLGSPECHIVVLWCTSIVNFYSPGP